MGGSALTDNTVMNEISKTEAAQKQLETAIDLFFNRKDDVSVVVLTYGSWSLIKDISKSNKKVISRDMLLSHFKEKYPGIEESKVWDILHHEWNFLKHAKRDINDKLTIDVRSLGLSILLASLDLLLLNSKSKITEIFILWYIASNNEPYENDASLDLIARKANDMFPNFSKLSFEVRCKYGSKKLKKLN